MSLLVSAFQVKLSLNLIIFYQIVREFLMMLQLILQSAFIVILGDFNARSKSWWSDDSTTTESTKLDSLAAIYGFHQTNSSAVKFFALYWHVCP